MFKIKLNIFKIVRPFNSNKLRLPSNFSLLFFVECNLHVLAFCFLPNISTLFARNPFAATHKTATEAICIWVWLRHRPGGIATLKVKVSWRLQTRVLHHLTADLSRISCGSKSALKCRLQSAEKRKSKTFPLTSQEAATSEVRNQTWGNCMKLSSR